MNLILSGLFLSAFLSATLLPGSSEIVLAGIVADGGIPVGIAVMVATLGNTLGSCVNWGLGRYFAGFRDRRWFPVTPQQYERYAGWYRRWGVWSLLFSWAPVIGDPLTLVAGAARTPFPLFSAIVLVAKAARYLAIAGAVSLV